MFTLVKTNHPVTVQTEHHRVYNNYCALFSYDANFERNVLCIVKMIKY